MEWNVFHGISVEISRAVEFSKGPLHMKAMMYAASVIYSEN